MTDFLNCGPSSSQCKCDCPSECAHVWAGPEVEVGNGMVALSCARCGMAAILHDLWTSD